MWPIPVYYVHAGWWQCSLPIHSSFIPLVLSIQEDRTGAALLQLSSSVGFHHCELRGTSLTTALTWSFWSRFCLSPPQSAFTLLWLAALRAFIAAEYLYVCHAPKLNQFGHSRYDNVIANWLRDWLDVIDLTISIAMHWLFSKHYVWSRMYYPVLYIIALLLHKLSMCAMYFI